MKKSIVSAVYTLLAVIPLLAVVPLQAWAHPEHGQEAHSMVHYLTGSHFMGVALILITGLVAVRFGPRVVEYFKR